MRVSWSACIFALALPSPGLAAETLVFDQQPVAVPLGLVRAGRPTLDRLGFPALAEAVELRSGGRVWVHANADLPALLETEGREVGVRVTLSAGEALPSGVDRVRLTRALVVRDGAGALVAEGRWVAELDLFGLGGEEPSIALRAASVEGLVGAGPLAGVRQERPGLLSDVRAPLVWRLAAAHLTVEGSDDGSLRAALELPPGITPEALAGEHGTPVSVAVSAPKSELALRGAAAGEAGGWSAALGGAGRIGLRWTQDRGTWRAAVELRLAERGVDLTRARVSLRLGDERTPFSVQTVAVPSPLAEGTRPGSPVPTRSRL